MNSLLRSALCFFIVTASASAAVRPSWSGYDANCYIIEQIQVDNSGNFLAAPTENIDAPWDSVGGTFQRGFYIYEPVSGKMIGYSAASGSGLTWDDTLQTVTLGLNTPTKTYVDAAVAGVTPSAPTINAGVTRSLVTATSSTGFQVSATKTSIVNYSVSTSTTATIGGASSVTAYLEVAATNSTTPSAWTIVSQVNNGQTITLAVILQSVQTNCAVLSGTIPAGYYARVRYAATGTSSATYSSGEETILAQ